MGDELIEKAQELKTMIQNSAEYQKYDSCRHILTEDEELYRKVNEFRKKNFEFQTEGSAENGQADRLAEAYADVLGQKAVMEYMNAELILCRKLQEIYGLLVGDLEFDLDFLQ